MASVRELFDAACDLPEGERTDWLRKVGTDADTLAQVLALLQADRAPTVPLPGDWTRALAATEAGVGDTVGAWRLLRELGAGGMGTVFLAERADGHFRQQAAVKLIRGLPDAAMAQRFARERQLLADLQHAQIARLLDGGATADGQPYLVMEYIEGIRLDHWVRHDGIDLTSRLDLFVSICRTVQFAHQQLIVHCDIKPSNVLVRADGMPVLLDFGIARVAAHAPGDPPGCNDADGRRAGPMSAAAPSGASPAAGATQAFAGALPMTPRYASPEQLQGQRPGVPGDIFALGLLLSELVTGQPPERIDGALAAAPSLAAGAVPWRRQLRGDLDAIVTRACAQDPAARYATAQALADDVGRMRAHRPVLARPATPPYRLARLLRRRWPLIATSTLGLVLATAFTWRTVVAEQRARLEARTAEHATDFLVSVFAASDSNVSDGALVAVSARDVLDRGRARIDEELGDQPAVRARLLEALGNAYRHMNQGAAAVPLLREAAALNLSPAIDDRSAAARCLEAATNAMANGEFPAAETEQVARQALVLAEASRGPRAQQTANAWMVLSLALNRNGKSTEAEQAARTTLAMNETLPPPEHRLSAAHHNLALILAERGELATAREHNRRALAMTEAGVIVHAMRLRGRALIERRAGDWAAAAATLHQALDIAARVHGDHGAFAIRYRRELAAVAIDRGDFAEADALLARAGADQAALGGEDGDEYLAIRHDRATVRLAAGEREAALAALEPVVAQRRARYGDDDPRTWSARLDAVEARLLAGKPDTALRGELDAALARWAAINEPAAVPALRAQLLRARWQLLAGSPGDAQSDLDGLEPHRARLPAAWQPTLAGLRAWQQRLLGDPSTTLAASEAAFAAHRQWLGDAHPRTAAAALVLARVLRENGQGLRADDLTRRWQARHTRGYPADSVFQQQPPEA